MSNTDGESTLELALESLEKEVGALAMCRPESEKLHGSRIRMFLDEVGSFDWSSEEDRLKKIAAHPCADLVRQWLTKKEKAG